MKVPEESLQLTKTSSTYQKIPESSKKIQEYPRNPRNKKGKTGKNQEI